MMTNSDTALQNSREYHNLGAGSADPQTEMAAPKTEVPDLGSGGIRLNLTAAPTKLNSVNKLYNCSCNYIG